jgi:hypothetical protein
VGTRRPCGAPAATRLRAAFDNGEDFARNDVIDAARANPGLYGRARLWIDVGRDDPFRSADTELARLLPRARFQLRPGGHNLAYLKSHATEIVGFYAAALAHCK